ncbi:hypothetical protein HY469_02045, partial [Candidatus Roizmanbacteria bacterium]|nr:hypothetical protein [Candidatus Roizmanbacteria bacterium]
MAENESRIVMVAKFPEFPEEGFPPGLPQILGVGLEYGAVEGGSPKEHVIFQIEVTAPHADVLPEWYQDLNAAPQTP